MDGEMDQYTNNVEMNKCMKNLLNSQNKFRWI